jgi:hypothetical protein
MTVQSMRDDDEVANFLNVILILPPCWQPCLSATMGSVANQQSWMEALMATTVSQRISTQHITTINHVDLINSRQSRCRCRGFANARQETCRTSPSPLSLAKKWLACVETGTDSFNRLNSPQFFFLPTSPLAV